MARLYDWDDVWEPYATIKAGVFDWLGRNQQPHRTRIETYLDEICEDGEESMLERALEVIPLTLYAIRHDCWDTVQEDALESMALIKSGEFRDRLDDEEMAELTEDILEIQLYLDEA